jgi:uncharacterized membrane protein YfcA
MLFLVSLAANLFSAFSGGGAGLIQLPVLIFLGLPFAVALATHKVASVALGIGATLRHLREETLERRLRVRDTVGGGEADRGLIHPSRPCLCFQTPYRVR